MARPRVAKAAQPPKHKDDLADLLGEALQKRLGYAPTKEFRFHPVRRWRFDLLFEPCKLVVEIDGAFHVSQKKLREDAEKRNAAIEAGYRVLNYPASSVLTKCRLPLIVDQIERVACGASDPDSSAYVLSREK